MTETTEKDPRLVEAEIEETLAKAAKARAEVANLALDRQIKEAEARQKEAHAMSAEYGAESMRVQTEATLRNERLTLASNHHHHVYNFKTPVFEDAVDACIAQLYVWHRLDPECDMTVKFNSPGGSVIDGMDLFDEVSRLSRREWDSSDTTKGTHGTTGVIQGWAASMAGILIQAFDHRVIAPRATLMIHEISTWARGKISEIEDEVEFMKQLSDSVTTVFVERSKAAKKRNPQIKGITATEFKKRWERREWYVSAKEALSLGFVDEIA